MQVPMSSFARHAFLTTSTRLDRGVWRPEATALPHRTLGRRAIFT